MMSPIRTPSLAREIAAAAAIFLAVLGGSSLQAQVIVSPTRIDLGSASEGEASRGIVTISNFTDTSVSLALELRGGATFRHTLPGVIILPAHRLRRDTIIYDRSVVGCDTTRLIVSRDHVDTVTISGCAAAPLPRARIWIDPAAARVAVPAALRINLADLPFPVDTFVVWIRYDPLAIVLDRIEPNGVIETPTPGVSGLRIDAGGRVSGMVGTLIVRGLSTGEPSNRIELDRAGNADSTFASVELHPGALDITGCATYDPQIFARAASIRSVRRSSDGTAIINVTVASGVEGTIRAIDFSGRTILKKAVRGGMALSTIVTISEDELPRGVCLLVLEAGTDRSCVFFYR